MYLATYSLKDEDRVSFGVEQASSSGSNAVGKQRSASFFAVLLGEERPADMLTLLSILVLLLHVSGWLWLSQPGEQTSRAQPLPMEVSMIAISAPKPSVEPAAPAPEIKSPPKKPKPRPMPKKMPQLVQKAPDFAPVEDIVEPQPVQQPVVQSSALSENKAVATDDQSFTEADFRANYAHNPKPVYPPAARNRGLQGKVMLRVRVSTEGLSDHVAVERSSGHDILDESAVEAVRKWRFIPAKCGETAVASSVIVPISFALR